VQQTFPKSERLNSKKFIEELFKNGAAFTHFPFKVIYLPLSREQACAAVGEKNKGNEPPVAQLLFSCSKRNFKKAVDRNLVKRRMREAYRKHKQGLPQNSYFLIAYIYIAREIFPYQFLEEKLKSSLKRLRSTSNSETSR
jgi:ribonuclease P protein component